MSFTPIEQDEVNTKKQLRQNLFQKIKDNFDDHELRIEDLVPDSHEELTKQDSSTVSVSINNQEISMDVIPLGISHNLLENVQTAEMEAVRKQIAMDLTPYWYDASDEEKALKMYITENGIIGIYEYAVSDNVEFGHVSDQPQLFLGLKIFTSAVTVPNGTSTNHMVNKGQMVAALFGTGASTHVANISNPHLVTKAQVGLGNVLNVAQLPESDRSVTIATLDATGKITESQIPEAIKERLYYKGTWRASINFPNLDLVDVKGSYFITSDDGVFNGTYYGVGDWIVSDGMQWIKVDNTDAVMSVAGKFDDVILDKSDVGLGNVDNVLDMDKPISTLAQTAIDNKSDLEHIHTTETISDVRILNGIFQFNDGSQWNSVDCGGLGENVYSAIVANAEIEIEHELADITKIVGQKSSIALGENLYIQGPAVTVGDEKFAVYINETTIRIVPYEDLGNSLVRIFLTTTI